MIDALSTLLEAVETDAMAYSYVDLLAFRLSERAQTLVSRVSLLFDGRDAEAREATELLQQLYQVQSDILFTINNELSIALLDRA